MTTPHDTQTDQQDPKQESQEGQQATIVMAHRLAESGTDLNPFTALSEAIAFSSADWGAARDLAWIYGIVLGWDDDDQDEVDERSTMEALADLHGWDDHQVERLQGLHAKFVSRATDEGAAPTPNVPASSGAREAAYAEAIINADPPETTPRRVEARLPEARAVMAVADAELRRRVAHLERECLDRDSTEADARSRLGVADAELAAVVAENDRLAELLDAADTAADRRLDKSMQWMDRAEAAESALAESRAELERQAVLLRAIKDCHDDPARAILQADILAGGAILRAEWAEAEVKALREAALLACSALDKHPDHADTCEHALNPEDACTCWRAEVYAASVKLALASPPAATPAPAATPEPGRAEGAHVLSEYGTTTCPVERVRANVDDGECSACGAQVAASGTAPSVEPDATEDGGTDA